ncbi:MAG: hypothetical protein M3R51_07365 [Candidatus Eremiobacteraeota bacterium]|nr:hypothetical protein [Candidatus Eremiobacteraeota bacterium]
MVLKRRHWIPPGALAFAQLAHGVSWVLLTIVAVRAGVDTLSGPALAWIHTVALGWLTMSALGILIHVVPSFTDLRWRNETIVRGSLLPFAAGVLLLVIGWFLTPVLVVIGALCITAAFLGYYIVSVRTLWRARAMEKAERAIARALTINLSFFLIVALIGTAMSVAIAFGWFAALLLRLPGIHANLAFYGWLTMLVYGVSARTMRPLCGVRSRFAWMHVAFGLSVLAGPVFVAIGIGTGQDALRWFGAGIIGVGALAYAFDIVDIVRRATVRHRPPQAFVVSAVAWLVLSVVLGFGTMLGKSWAPAYVFVVLVGWIGQMVNAHFLHIGVRLIATIVRGDDDETPPATLLDRRLSWFSLVGMQSAVLLCCAGLLVQNARLVEIGAIPGLCAWFALVANGAVVTTRAKALPISLVS